MVKAHIALIIVNLIFGINYIIVKEVTPTFILPYGLILIRVASATAMFWLLHSILKKAAATNTTALIKEPIRKQDWGRLVACGISGIAINQLLFYKGLSITTAINAALIMITVPILVLIIAALLIGEKITKQKALGILLGAVGAIGIILSGASKQSGAAAYWLGDVLIFLNATSYAVYLVLVKPLMQHYHPVTIIKWVFTIGLAPIIMLGWPEFAIIEWQTLHTSIWWALAFIIVCTTFVTYLLNMYALGKVSPSIVSAYIYTQPLVATSAAILLGKDTLQANRIIAGILIFLGVYFVAKTQKQTQPQ